MKRSQPVIPEEYTKVNDLNAALEDSGYQLAEAKMQNLDIVAEDLTDSLFSECCFEKCTFESTKMKKSYFTDVVFKSCDLSNCNLSECNFTRCSFLSCKGTGTNFLSSGFKDVEFIDSNFKYANFDQSNLRSVLIQDSDFSRAELTGCKLKAFELDKVIFNGTQFAHTLLKDVDFTSCDITAIGVTTESRELKGAIFDITQAAELATLLGIVIRS